MKGIEDRDVAYYGAEKAALMVKECNKALQNVMPHVLKELHELYHRLPKEVQEHDMSIAVNVLGNICANVIEIIYPDLALNRKNELGNFIALHYKKVLTVGDRVDETGTAH